VNIEEITALKELMEVTPLELTKKQAEINGAFDTIGILENFQFKFSAEDITRQWQVYGGPSEILALVDSTREAMEKEENKFRD